MEMRFIQGAQSPAALAASWRAPPSPPRRPRRRGARSEREFRGGPFGFRRGGGPGRWARTRSQGAARRHPHGGAAAAGGGAAQRLPDHAGGPGAQRRHLEPEPRLGLPGAGAARGRGPDPHAGERRAQAVRDHRRGPRGRGRARQRPAGSVGADGRRRRWLARAGKAHARGRLRVRAGDAHGQRGPDRQGTPACWRQPAATSTGSSPTATSVATPAMGRAPTRMPDADAIQAARMPVR